MSFWNKLFGGKESASEIIAASQNGEFQKVKALVIDNPDLIFSKDKNAWTPLHWAVLKDYKDVVELLLANKADVNAKNNEGQTPLHMEVAVGREDMVKLLIASSADVNAQDNDGGTPLHFAASGGQKNAAAMLLANSATINAKSKDGSTPLHFAVEAGHKEVAALLLTNKADVHVKVNKNGRTPLHEAAFKGQKDTAELLLANKADINAQDNNGWTPLHYTASFDHRDVAKLLLDSKADANVKNNLGATALDCAEVCGHNDFAELLRQQFVTSNLQHAATDQNLPVQGRLAEKSSPHSIKVYEKNVDDSFTETKGDLSLAPVLFEQAVSLYKKVKQAARSYKITPDDEKDLVACIDFLTKLMEVHPIRGSGVPNAMRGEMYFISAQANRRKDQFDKAESDYLKAIDIGDSDPSNLANWRDSLEQIRKVRGML